MGRIKTAQVKRITKQLMAAHAAELNVVAGYAARLVKQQQAQSGPRRAVHKEDLSQYY
ncbi:hypothetical protein J4435_03780 [Candidatus Woesearchaeota archaeon]|nr:hypothetical protein [Candidatus Woesearchaeota archaeon]